jgi:RNA polymerase sigma-70 factor (ECF subfamily)
MRDRVLNKIGKPSVTVGDSGDLSPQEELVAASKHGDELAFQTLVKLYHQRLFVIAFRYTRVREDAEDIVQQTFQKAFVHLQGFEEKSALSTWLTRIAINEALMLLRSRRALHEVPIDDSSSPEETTPLLELADASPDPEASYSQVEGARILTAAIRQLRPGTRRAIELRGLSELSTRETAAHLGVSVGTVKARVFHARRQLAKALSRCMRSRRVSGNGISSVAEDSGRVSQDRLTCARN